MWRIAAILFVGLILCSCASGWNMGDVIPHWLGGPPKNLPPRAGQPGYEEYMRRAREGTIPAEKKTDPAEEKTDEKSSTKMID